MTLKLFTIDALIVDKLSGTNLDHYEEEYEEVILHSFKYKIDFTEKVSTYLVCQNIVKKHSMN